MDCVVLDSPDVPTQFKGEYWWESRFSIWLKRSWDGLGVRTSFVLQVLQRGS